MAKFQVGQRVRFDGEYFNANWQVEYTCQATIERAHDSGNWDWWIRTDAGLQVAALSKELTPLTPPHEACDPEFAESIRRLTDSVSA